MTETSDKNIQEIIVEVVAARCEEAGNDRSAINLDTDLMTVFDSFAFLDVILDVEERAGVDVDLSKMDIGNTLPLNIFVREILRINALK